MKNDACSIFVAFMKRDGILNAEDAKKEFKLLVLCDCEDDYLRANRVGLISLGNRAGRKSVWLSYENAKNHASFFGE